MRAISLDTTHASQVKNFETISHFELVSVNGGTEPDAVMRDVTKETGGTTPAYQVTCPSKEFGTTYGVVGKPPFNPTGPAQPVQTNGVYSGFACEANKGASQVLATQSGAGWTVR